MNSKTNGKKAAKKKIAVIFGGFSPEYGVSLKSAYSIINAISKEKYEIVMLGITRKGEWYRYKGSVEALPTDEWHTDERYLSKAYISPERGGGIIEYDNGQPFSIPVDAIFPVLHGRYGEDGTIQGLCELAGIPVVGSGSAAAALCMDKERSHKIISLLGITVPKSVCFERALSDDEIMAAAKTLELPVFVKPVKAGSSIGVTKVYDYGSILQAVRTALIYDNAVIIEENIKDREIGCAVMGNHELITGRVNEIIVEEGGYFSFEEKYTLKSSKIITPADIDEQTERRVQSVGETIFRALGCRGYARIDMFLKADGDIVFSEANTIPGFTVHSQFPKMMKEAGIEYPELVDMLLELSMQEEGHEWYGKVTAAKARPDVYGRAWIEIDMDALSHNLSDIRSKIPQGCEIMAVLKADAYGHGFERVAKRLVREGVSAFAVATVAEGALLREIVPDGEILVLGRSHARDAACLSDHNLTVLVADDVHAGELNEAGYKLRIHIAVDTGMHRLGTEPDNFDDIERIFNYENLTVCGIGTHLASADSLESSDVDFTIGQMERLCALVKKLNEKGYDVGKIHSQSSYGIYNYPHFKCDYVRPGIMLYGVHSHDAETREKTGLRPMLSLKADISQVRQIKAGESVSYGRLFTAKNPMTVATVSIGYADGIPRQMTDSGGMAIVNGVKVPVIGRICMDMLMLDVSGVPGVKAGDVATFIGTDKNEQIRCEELAAVCGTITNDILCRLGSRLPRVYN
ncbi:MAG: serine racemase VanT catalytic subunit [Oscillospiraceae bacterium]|nr:serine racemase VanT catalytic subunit [Oscillospiraceae bacterium]